MKINYFIHDTIKPYFTLSPHPLCRAMIKPRTKFKTKKIWTRHEDAMRREEKTGHRGPLIMRSRRWKYFANGEFYLLYSRRQQQAANGVTPQGERGMTDALKKWTQSHLNLLPSKLAPRQAEGYHD
ncbi:hypothetical protein ACLECU_04145 [Lonsdalea quercina]|uniref:hypothetical protein n=1 Tax=Lonsdalea quercina TaxID=71657 RepID=UPI003975B890